MAYVLYSLELLGSLSILKFGVISLVACCSDQSPDVLFFRSNKIQIMGCFQAKHFCIKTSNYF